mgnify:CR=1 FL=1
MKPKVLQVEVQVPIYFFLPEKDNIVFPDTIDDFWVWISNTKGLSDWWGRYHWVLQTYLSLKKFGFRCEICREFPQDGIVISHRDFLATSMKFDKRNYIVCMLVDRMSPLPYANFHILHNPVQKIRFYNNYAYIPPWPQVALVPRNIQRGNRFSTIGYFGYPENLTSNFKESSFLSAITNQGLSFYIPNPQHWNDFSNIDAIVGIRNFGRNNEFINKPALKLYNAWLAGIPAIMGYESAYRSEGMPSQDYLEATSPREVLEHLSNLKKDLYLRHQLVDNGRQKVKEFTAERTVHRWIDLIEGKIIPDYLYWRYSTFKRQSLKIIGRIREGLIWRYNLIYK